MPYEDAKPVEDGVTAIAMAFVEASGNDIERKLYDASALVDFGNTGACLNRR